MSLFKRKAKAAGGVIPAPNWQYGPAERVGSILISKPKAVYPDWVVARYDRRELEKRVGGPVYSASEMLAARGAEG